MIDFSPDKVLQLGSSLALFAFETVANGARALASFTDLHPGIIGAVAASGLTVIVALKLFFAGK